MGKIAPIIVYPNEGYDSGETAKNKLNEAMQTAEVSNGLSGDGTSENPIKLTDDAAINNETYDIPAGVPIAVIGAENGVYTVDLASALEYTRARATWGFSTSIIPKDGGAGTIRNKNDYALDTSAFAMDEGRPMFLGSAPGTIVAFPEALPVTPVFLGILKKKNASGIIGIDIVVDLESIVREKFADLKNPTGFVLNGTLPPDDNTLSYDAGTRTLTITPTDTTFEIELHGLLNRSIEQSVQHAVTKGTYFFWFDTDFVLQSGAVNEVFDILNTVTVAFVIYNPAATPMFRLSDERHGFMDPRAHIHAHLSLGAFIEGGVPAISGYNLNGAVDTDNQYIISAHNLWDEDLLHMIPESVKGVYELWERVGADGDWSWNDGLSFPAAIVANTPQFNEFTGGAWQRTPMATNTYMNVYLASYNAYDTAKAGIVVLGQVNYVNLVDAQEETTSDLDLAAFIYNEYAFIYKVTIYYKATTIPTTGRFNIAAISAVITEKTGNPATGITHNSTTDRGALNAHPSSAISYDNSAGNLVATVVKTALDELDGRLAGVGVPNGGVSDQTQPIAGAKTLTDGLSVYSGLDVNGELKSYKYNRTGDPNRYGGVTGLQFKSWTGGGFQSYGGFYYKESQGLGVRTGKFYIVTNSLTEPSFAADNIPAGAAIYIDENGYLGLIKVPVTSTPTTPVLARNSSTGKVEQIIQLSTASIVTGVSLTPVGARRENEVYITALADDITINAPSGTPVNGNTLMGRIKDDGTARALDFDPIFRAIGVTIPATTVANKTLYWGAIYNSADSKWDIVSVVQEA